MKGLRLGVVSWLCLVGACSAALDYPEASRESTALRCGNGLDDDFDGLVDCADPECDGHCGEQGAACSDGRNNDGDALFGTPLVDAADPACWSLGHDVERRCAFRPGSVLELRRWSPYESFSSPDWVTSGTVDEGDDGPNYSDVIRLLPRQYIETRSPTTGATATMGTEVIVELEPGAELVLSFISSRFGSVIAAHFAWPLASSTTTMWIEKPDGTRSAAVTTGLEDKSNLKAKLQLFVGNGRWWLRSITTGAPAVSLPYDVSLPLDEPLLERLEARSETGNAAGVQFVRVARASYDTCGRSHASPLVNAPGLRAVAEGGGGRCIVLGDRAHRATDAGLWEPSRTALRPGDLALTWVDAFQRYEGVRLDPSDGTLRYFASNDCDLFRESAPLPVADATGLVQPRLVGFDHRVEQPSGARRVHLLGADAGGALRLVELASPTGTPGSYVEVGARAWPFDVWTAGRPLSVGRIGDSLWALGPGAVAGDAALRIATGEGDFVTIDPFVAPSGEAGAFDRYRVEQAQLVPFAPTAPGGPLRARVYYFGSLGPRDPGYDSSAVRSGVDWIDFSFGAETP